MRPALPYRRTAVGGDLARRIFLCRRQLSAIDKSRRQRAALDATVVAIARASLDALEEGQCAHCYAPLVAPRRPEPTA